MYVLITGLLFFMFSVCFLGAQSEESPEKFLVAEGTCSIDTAASDQEEAVNDAYLSASVIALRNLAEKVDDVNNKREKTLPAELIRHVRVTCSSNKNGEISINRCRANYGTFTLESFSKTKEFLLIEDKITLTSQQVEILIDDFVPVSIIGLNDYHDLLKLLDTQGFSIEYIRDPSGESVTARLFFKKAQAN